MQSETLGSAPALFRNFGCGAFCVIFLSAIVMPISGIPQDGLAQIAGKISPNFLLSSLAVIACYYVGALCSAAGFGLLSFFPKQFLEKQVELEADALTFGLSELRPYIDRRRFNLENSYTAAGVGFFLICAQIGAVLAYGTEVISLPGVFLSVSTFILGSLQVYAVIARFRMFFLMVKLKKLEELMVGALERGPSKEMSDPLQAIPTPNPT